MPKNRKQRSTKKTVLIATNGLVTERTYLNELKIRANRLGDISVTVTCINGDPEGMLRKLKSTRDTQYNASAYDEVWLVFDEDGKDRSSLFAKCSQLSTMETALVRSRLAPLLRGLADCPLRAGTQLHHPGRRSKTLSSANSWNLR